MKLFLDCEVMRHHWRGANAAVIVGDRAITTEEGESLMRQFSQSFGSGLTPAYLSPDGWQMLGGAATAAGPLESRFQFDEQNGLVLVDGLKIASPMFDALGKPTPAGRWLRVVAVEGGVITMESQTIEQLRADGGTSGQTAEQSAQAVDGGKAKATPKPAKSKAGA